MSNRLEFTLGERMEKALRSSGLNQADMAHTYGVSRATISNWLHGRTNPSTATVRVWAILTSVPLEWLETGNIPEEGK